MAAVRGARRGVRLGAVVGSALGAALLAGCGSQIVGTEVPVVPSTPPAATAPAAPDEAAERALPVYYVTDTPAGPRLAREFRRLTVDTDAGSAALTAMFASPTGTVPEHRNTWPTGSALAAPVGHADGVVTVDLASGAVDATPADPILAVQQLVYTVTGALGTTDPVRILVDGKQVTRIWGDGVNTAQPVQRADPLGIRVLVGIDDPAEGATVGSPVRVAGEAAVFEATLLWEVRRGDEVVRSGAASTTEGQRFAPYTFSVELPPGDYEVRVAEDDPSDGAGRPSMTDSRRITVTS